MIREGDFFVDKQSGQEVVIARIEGSNLLIKRVGDPIDPGKLIDMSTLFTSFSDAPQVFTGY